jgi:hypothetical protein
MTTHQGGTVKRYSLTRRAWMILGVVAAFLALASYQIGIASSSQIEKRAHTYGTHVSAGDPYGRIMTQLQAIAAILPDFGTSKLPLSSSAIPDGNYLTLIEPFWDSCDGQEGTFGWSNAVVQAGFHWNSSPESLFQTLDERLRAIGWRNVRNFLGNSKSFASDEWIGELPSGIHASLELIQGQGSSPDQSGGERYANAYEFEAIAPPVGKQLNSC